MQQVTIAPNQAGQRLDKFLHKYLPEAGTGFLYKMLRKKNITLNKKKAEGREILQQGDVVTFFFAEETFLKLAGSDAATTMRTAKGSDAAIGSDSAEAEHRMGSAPRGDGGPLFSESKTEAYRAAYKAFEGQVFVVYEDADIAALNKPSGVLTQKAEAGDMSLNEWLVGYLLERGETDAAELHSFRPSVCNRLDRNTSGIVLCGKSLAGSRYLSEAIRERRVSKLYRTICAGELREALDLDGYLHKDPMTNRVRLAAAGAPDEKGREEYIRTACHPITCKNGYTLLEVELFTGKPHQIRAHLASIGHPVIGDYKYGDWKLNDALKRECGLEYQLLHAHRVVLEDGREFLAPYPELFRNVAGYLGLPL